MLPQEEKATGFRLQEKCLMPVAFLLTSCFTLSEATALILVEDLTPRKTPGDVVGLFLRTHRGRVGRQVTRRRNEHVRAGRSVTQTGVLREGSFDGLYRVEIAILPEEQAAHRRQEPVILSSAVEIAGHQLSGLVYPLSLV